MEILLESLQALLSADALVYVPIITLVGIYLKQFTPLENRFIPLVLVAVSVFFMGIRLTVIDRFAVADVLEQGIVITGVAVLMHVLATKTFVNKE